MSDRVFLAPQELPPKPDPATGQPWPPRAPGILLAEKSAGKQRRDRVTNPLAAPAPPDGEERLLAWFKPSWFAAFRVIVWGTPLFALGLIVERGGDIEWMGFWQLWAMIPLFVFGLYSLMRPAQCSAGAEWLQVGKKWIRLYELVEVKGRHRNHESHVYLKDDAGRELMASVEDLQRNRNVWDLVYNGISHSVIAGGALTNLQVHGEFEVPRPEGKTSMG